jgi:phosphatidylglycerol:prolipoprotein diacylglycerol transferase
MLPDTLHIGPFPIHWFGIFLALALLAAGWAAGREFARQGIDRQLAWDAVLWGAIGGLVGARLWMVVETWPAFLSDPQRFLFSGSGLAWYGGFAGGALALTLWLRRRSIPWLAGADAIAPALALGHAIGRIGCQVAGDGDWGTETRLPWGMAYPHAVVGWDKPPGVRVHPTPIYEMLAYLAVFVILARMRRVPEERGRVFGTYLVLAGLARFLVEFVRVNPRVVWGLTVAQVSSLVIVAVGAVLLLRRRSPSTA